jgi:alpha-galactosidase
MSVTPDDLQARDAWVTEHLLAAQPPFSFRYGGHPSDALLADALCACVRTALSNGRTRLERTWSLPDGLNVRCEAVTYADYPVVEWTVYLSNTGAKATPILEQVRGLDTQLQRDAAGEFVLHYQRGDWCSADSYQPQQQPLWPNMQVSFEPVGGRPCSSAFPYFDVEMPGGGLMLAVGWPGQWRTTFECNDARGLRIAAGQALTHLALQPGEEIRTPLIALSFWRGDARVRAHNVWRRWMLQHNLPRPHGHPVAPLYAFCSGGFFPGLKVSAASEKQFLDVLAREGIALDYWWMDAGWYPCEGWPTVGTWRPDPERFPHGLKEVSDHAARQGAGLIVWFEPERVSPGTWLHEHHPEWLIARSDLSGPLSPQDSQLLFNLGDPDARAWLTEHVDRLIGEQGIALYRQDHNFDPLPYWRAHDAPDRQGSTENRHVCGYLAYWDALRERHPNMLIDSCAGGGRRNDLESLRRAVPLLRSDYQSFEGDLSTATGNQCHTYALSSWFPYYGHGAYYNPLHTAREIAYMARSYFAPAWVLAVDVRLPGIDWDLYRRLVSEWRAIADSMLGDYYPLTPYTLSEEAWIAWQFHRVEADSGVAQAYRRCAAPLSHLTLPLQGLRADRRYTLRDLVSGQTWQLAGADLLTTGLPLEIGEAPGAAVLVYAPEVHHADQP